MKIKKNYTLPIIMMFALFFMIAFVTGLQNPMGIIIKISSEPVTSFHSWAMLPTLLRMPLWAFLPDFYFNALVTKKRL